MPAGAEDEGRIFHVGTGKVAASSHTAEKVLGVLYCLVVGERGGSEQGAVRVMREVVMRLSGSGEVRINTTTAAPLPQVGLVGGSVTIA